ncbi:hypothetical protein BCV72DRAFT_201609, partial [Rhizopus microsporus var. microsporus]
CHDLLRLEILVKDSIDHNKLEYALAFKYMAYLCFSITFYLISLSHHKLYEMIKVAHMMLPGSLEELPSFVSLKTLQALFFVCETSGDCTSLRLILK